MSSRLARLQARAVASPSSESPALPDYQLPDYQPPSCPLDDAARRALGDLSNNQGTIAYQMHLKDSVRFISSAIGDLQERLRDGRKRLEQEKKRTGKGNMQTLEDMRLEKHVKRFETQASSLTDDLEVTIRDMIDHQAELEDVSAILHELGTRAAPQAAEVREASASQAAEGTEASTPQAAEVSAPPSTRDHFNAQRAEKDAKYKGLSMHQRYAQNNDYAHFKKVWHDAMAGEEGAPLPDASRWFSPDGQPVMHGLAEGLDSEDDDIAVAREVISIKCPLTLQIMNQPYTNSKCKHTFEESAILEYLAVRGEKRCPQTGCSQMHSRATFERDFFLDHAMVRRIRRARQIQEHPSMEDDDEVDDDDATMTIS